MAGAEAGATVAGRPARRRGLMFAGALLGTAGLMDMVVAVVAGSGDSYAVMDGWTMYQLDLTGWGWLHGIVGLASLAVGLLLVAGRPGAARIAVPVAVLSGAVDLLILPYEPYRAVLALGFTVAAIRACVVNCRPAGGSGSDGLSPTGRSGR